MDPAAQATGDLRPHRIEDHQDSAGECPLTLGRRVAEQRRKHGWSQPELAHRLGKPVSWVSQLERGLLQVEPLPVLRVLFVQPVPADGPETMPGASVADQVRALRHILTGQLRHKARPGVLAIQTIAGRRALATRVWELTSAGRYADLADLISDLLPALVATIRSVPEQRRPELYELVASCYQACSAALAKLGDFASAAVAAERSLTAAECACDPLAVASGAYLLVCSLLEAGRNEEASEVAAAAAAALVPSAANGNAAAICFRGGLTLLCALSAARAGDFAAADEQLSRAQVMAGRMSHADSFDDSAFSADHVALYEIVISIESAAVGYHRPESTAASPYR
jgi:hypothetical protein